MTQCPDCDSTRTFVEAEGDGKCSACHGTGWAGFLLNVVDVIGGEAAECAECQGTGECPTCMGSGILEERPISVAV